METPETKQPQYLVLRPAAVFAFIKIFPLLFATIAFMWLAWHIFPALIWLSLLSSVAAVYRYVYIHNVRYEIGPEIIRITQGIFFKRIDQVELYRLKDYVITRSFILQILRLMNLTLKSTDPENPILWLRGIPYSDLVDTIREHVQEARQHNRIYEIN